MHIDEWLAEREHRCRAYKRGQQRAAAQLAAHDAGADNLEALMRSIRALDRLYLRMWERMPDDVTADAVEIER